MFLLWNIIFFRQIYTKFIFEKHLKQNLIPSEDFHVLKPISYPIPKVILFMVGGLEHGFFFHILGIVTPTDFHIFQRDWNHQAVFMGGINKPLPWSQGAGLAGFFKCCLQVGDEEEVKYKWTKWY
jgi:hypothetical protein